MVEATDIHDTTKELVDTWALPTEPKAPAIPATVPKQLEDLSGELPDVGELPANTDPELKKELVKAAKEERYEDCASIIAEINNKPRPMPSEMQAEIAIQCISTVQAMLLNPLINRKMKRRLGEDYESAMIMLSEIEDGKRSRKDLNDKERIWWVRVHNLYDTQQNLTFSADEIDRMKGPMMELIKNNGYQIPPNMAFYMALGEVMAPKLASVFLD